MKERLLKYKQYFLVMSSDLILLEIRLVLCLQAYWTSFLLHTSISSVNISASFWEASTLSGYPHIPYIQHTKLVMHTDKYVGNTSKSVFEVKGCLSSSASAVAFDMSTWYFDLFHTGFNSLSYVNTHTPMLMYTAHQTSHIHFTSALTNTGLTQYWSTYECSLKRFTDCIHHSKLWTNIHRTLFRDVWFL